MSLKLGNSSITECKIYEIVVIRDFCDHAFSCAWLSFKQDSNFRHNQTTPAFDIGRGELDKDVRCAVQAPLFTDR